LDISRVEQELQEETRKNIESKQQLKRADGFIRKLGQIINAHRKKEKNKKSEVKMRHIEELKDIPALEYLSKEINKLLHSHLVIKPKFSSQNFQRTKSEERLYTSLVNSLDNANDSISGFRRISNYERLPPSKGHEDMKEGEENKDEESSYCECCHKEFTWYRWKHHCRICGKLICEACSPYKQYVVGYSDNKVRVCKECRNTKKKNRSIDYEQ